MQYKNCFIIGHTQKHCKNNTKCFVCSSTDHNPKECEEVKCINSQQQHRSNNRNCPIYKKRQAILKYKTLNKCSFKEATIAVNQLHPNSKEIITDSLKEALDFKNKISQQKQQRQSLALRTHNNQKPLTLLKTTHSQLQKL